MSASPVTVHPLLHVLFPGLTLGRAVGMVGLGCLVALLIWLSPVSPAALGPADAALGMGNPEVAAARYDRVARLNPFPHLRDEALYRAAMVHAVDLGQPEQARQRLDELVARRPAAERLADAHEQIGHLRVSAGDRPELAAEAFLAAYAAAPDTHRAAERLKLAARARVEAGDAEGSVALWRQVRERFPELEAAALLGKAEIRLGAGDAHAALGLYEVAAQLAPPGALEVLARMGAAAALERLGDLDEALAELDLADLPDEIRLPRAEGIRARAAARGP